MESEIPNMRDSKVAGRFEIIRNVGQGAFGAVYQARDSKLNQPVLLKVANSPQPEFAQRFNLEKDALRKIDSLYIAKVVDSGILEDGRGFIATEYIEGMSLKQVLDQQGPLNPTAALTICEQVAAALCDAHQSGLVHRDIKPANIIVVEKIDDLQAIKIFVADFGVAGVLRTETETTRAGEIFGTPHYMAPEQILGLEQDPRTDVYALGIVLFESLAGQKPFSGGSALELMQKIINSHPAIDKLGLPDRLTDFIGRCLAKAPDARPSNGCEALAQIKKLLTHFEPNDGIRPTEPAPALKAESPAKTRKVPRIAALGIALVVILIVASFVVFLPALPAGGGVSFHAGTAGLGLALIIAGCLLGFLLHIFLENRHQGINRSANEILTGSQDRDSLSVTLALEVDELMNRVRRLDERIMARTVAIMVQEYQTAKDTGDRQAALFKTAELLQKLMDRLSPWYVRYEKLLVFLLTGIGVVSGVISILKSFSATTP